jgi:UDP-2,3-diacylglucosamine pyrophosphatase LpxH
MRGGCGAKGGMIMVSQAIPDSFPVDRSVIVVSDFHLGLAGKEKVGENFSDFIKFIGNLKPKGAPGEHVKVTVDGKPRELYTPGIIVLLGDIFDMWSPRENVFSSVLDDAYPFIQPLLALPAKIVYVVGNHDEVIADFNGRFPKIFPEKVIISGSHYPDSGEGEGENRQFTGLKVGDHNYFFLHGQQFDLMFNTAGLLQGYPGWVTKNYSIFREHARLKWFFRSLFVISIGYLAITGIMKNPTPFDGLFYFLLGLTFVIFLFSIKPSRFREFWDHINLRIKAKDETIENIIEQGFWKPEAGKNILADVVVFGHTHLADDSRTKYMNTMNKRFINSGAWGDKTAVPDGEGKRIPDTFVYIDAEGAFLLSWPEGGPLPLDFPQIVTGIPKKAAPPPSPIKLWIRRSLYTKG